MPTLGSRLGARSIWKDDSSSTWTRPGAGGSSARIAVPMLPPICTSQPAGAKTWAVSAVVVDLPLVPVMAMKGASGAMRGALAAEQLDVADDLDAGGSAPAGPSSAAPGGSAARRGQHQRGEAATSRRRAGPRPRRRPPRPWRAPSPLSSQPHAGAARHSAAPGEPGAAEPEQGEVWPAKRDGSWAPHAATAEHRPIRAAKGTSRAASPRGTRFAHLRMRGVDGSHAVYRSHAPSGSTGRPAPARRR